MPRIVKDPEERKEELIKAALSLFETSGYDRTSVENIVNAAGVAKGTFYYYFKSKEIILEELFKAYLLQFKPFFNKIIKNPNLNAVEKIQKIFQFMLGSSEDEENDEIYKILPIQVINFLSRDSSAIVLRKFGAVGRKIYIPILTSIIKEGNKAGLLNVEYPEDIIEFLLEIVRYLAEISHKVKIKELQRKKLAINRIFSRTLGVKEGLFNL